MPKHNVPHNTPNKPYTRAERTRQEEESRRGGAANQAAEILGDDPMGDDDEQPGPSSAARAPGGNQRAGGGDGAGGTMVSGGMRAASRIPPTIDCIRGVWSQTRYHTYLVEIPKTWGPARVWHNRPASGAPTAYDLEWISPYFHVPAGYGAFYITAGLDDFLNHQMYWNVKVAGWKVNKVNILRETITPANSNAPQARTDSAWQPQLLELNDRNIPQQFRLYYDRAIDTSKVNNDVAEVWRNSHKAWRGELPSLARVGFTIQTKVGGSQPASPWDPPFNAYMSSETLSQADIFEHRTTRYEMNSTLPLQEIKCMKGWRHGSVWANKDIKAYDSNPDRLVDTQTEKFGIMAPRWGETDDPTYEGDATSRHNYTTKRHKQPKGFPQTWRAPLGFYEGDITTAFRSSNDMYMPHITENANTQSFLRFSTPPRIADAQTKFYAEIHLETEIGGEYENCWPLAESEYVTFDKNGGHFAGDKRHVMVNNHYTSNLPGGARTFFPATMWGTNNLTTDPLP